MGVRVVVVVMVIPRLGQCVCLACSVYVEKGAWHVGYYNDFVGTPSLLLFFMPGASPPLVLQSAVPTGDGEMLDMSLEPATPVLGPDGLPLLPPHMEALSLLPPPVQADSVARTCVRDAGWPP